MNYATRPAVLALGLSLGACTVIPGLHVSEGRATESYRVTVVDAEVVALLAKEVADPIVPLRKAELRATPAVAGLALSPPAAAIPLTPMDNAVAYQVGPGDVLSIIVWDHPELTNPTGEFRDPESSGRLVASDGTMFYPYVGVFNVQGQTVSQIRDHLTQRLTKVIQSPQVDVRVAAFRAHRIQITGEVKQPGLVTLDDTPKGVLEAIGERGGLTDAASRRQVILKRGGEAYRIDLAALLSGVRTVVNPRILPGDIIHVPDSGTDRVFVMGEVKASAPVTMLQNGLTLTEALTTVGGLDRLSAQDSGLLIFRRGQEVVDGKPTIFVLDLGKPEGMLLANEFDLAPRDVVYVKATSFSKYNSVINQLLPTISAVFQVDRLTAE